MPPALELGLADVDRFLKALQILLREIQRRFRQLDVDEQLGNLKQMSYARCPTTCERVTAVASLAA